MSIQVLDPRGEVATIERRAQAVLGSVEGRKAGFVFNGHASCHIFWKALEREVEQRFKPSAMSRVYKVNTWAPAPQADLSRVREEADYVLVGIGA